MSRRGGHDRYRTRDLQRGVVHDGYTLPRTQADDRRRLLDNVEFRHVIVDCLHGVPWTTCELCSKPRSKR